MDLEHNISSLILDTEGFPLFENSFEVEENSDLTKLVQKIKDGVSYHNSREYLMILDYIFEFFRLK